MIINYLIPKHKPLDELQLVRAKVIIYLLGATPILALFSDLVNHLSQAQSIFPCTPLIILCIVLLIVFKYTGSFNFVGNAAAAGLYTILTYLSLYTGGIFSADTLGLFIVPLTAFTLVDKKSALFWMIAVLGWKIYLLSLVNTPEAINYYREQTLQYPTYYYLIVALTLMLFVIGCFSIFYAQNQQLILQLHRQKQQLAENNQKLAQKNQQLEAIQEELERSNEELEQYAHVTSHDLKQPLRNINSFTQLLQKYLIKKNWIDATSTEYLNFINYGTKSMTKLVYDLLNYAKLKTDKNFHFVEMNLNDLLQQVKMNIKNDLDQEIVKIKSDLLPTVPVIPTKINQIFQNIITNAIKFRKKDQAAIIQIHAKEEVNHWLISIQDNGIGIEKHNLNKIFKPFKKLHGESEYAGSGIGLATCKRIVTLHDGKIWADSQIGVGTTFYFTLSKKRPSKIENQATTRNNTFSNK